MLRSGGRHIDSFTLTSEDVTEEVAKETSAGALGVDPSGKTQS